MTSDTSSITVKSEILQDLRGVEHIQQNIGVRKSGRVWKEQKKPMRISSMGVGQKSWEKKKEERIAMNVLKSKERELKKEKENEKKKKVEERKEREALKAEKEKYDNIAKKMHAKVCSIFKFLFFLLKIFIIY